MYKPLKERIKVPVSEILRPFRGADALKEGRFIAENYINTKGKKFIFTKELDNKIKPLTSQIMKRDPICNEFGLIPTQFNHNIQIAYHVVFGLRNTGLITPTYKMEQALKKEKIITMNSARYGTHYISKITDMNGDTNYVFTKDKEVFSQLNDAFCIKNNNLEKITTIGKLLDYPDDSIKWFADTYYSNKDTYAPAHSKIYANVLIQPWFYTNEYFNAGTKINGNHHEILSMDFLKEGYRILQNNMSKENFEILQFDSKINSIDILLNLTKDNFLKKFIIHTNKFFITNEINTDPKDKFNITNEINY